MREPYKQGNLDGLCGVYAVINAIGSILPENNLDKFLPELFNVCINKLDRRTKLAKTIINGMSISMIKEMLNDCMEYMNDRYILKYKCICEDRKRIDGIINDIKNSLSNNKNIAIIIGITCEDFSHWTTINKKFIKTIKFYDSDDIPNINIDKLCAGKYYKLKKYNIQPNEVISVWIE